MGDVSYVMVIWEMGIGNWGLGDLRGFEWDRLYHLAQCELFIDTHIWSSGYYTQQYNHSPL